MSLEVGQFRGLDLELGAVSPVPKPCIDNSDACGVEEDVHVPSSALY